MKIVKYKCDRCGREVMPIDMVDMTTGPNSVRITKNQNRIEHVCGGCFASFMQTLREWVEVFK